MNRTLKTFVLLVALATMLGVATASTLPAHWHNDAAPGRCDLCFTAHVAVFESPSAQALPAPELSGRALVVLRYFGYKPTAAAPGSSRGPPALFSSHSIHS